MVIRTHLQDLKDVTSSVHYENYRCRKLAGLSHDGKPHRINSNKYVSFQSYKLISYFSKGSHISLCEVLEQITNHLNIVNFSHWFSHLFNNIDIYSNLNILFIII